MVLAVCALSQDSRAAACCESSNAVVRRVIAASPTHCLPGKQRGLAGAEGKGRIKHNRSNRKQLDNLFSIYVSTHRGRGKPCAAFSCC